MKTRPPMGQLADLRGAWDALECALVKLLNCENVTQIRRNLYQVRDDVALRITHAEQAVANALNDFHQ